MATPAHENDCMDEPVMSEPYEQLPRPTTAPDSFTVSAREFDTEDRAQQIASLLWTLVRELSSSSISADLTA